MVVLQYGIPNGIIDPLLDLLVDLVVHAASDRVQRRLRLRLGEDDHDRAIRHGAKPRGCLDRSIEVGLGVVAAGLTGKDGLDRVERSIAHTARESRSVHQSHPVDVPLHVQPVWFVPLNTRPAKGPA